MSDYKNTLNLPQTDFSMKANLAQQEPKRLSWWQENDIYQKIRTQLKGNARFVLHDGPPYANGHLHCGHALNKILKDIIIKSKTLNGIDAPFVPGWDCHGLPIELNVEKKIGKAGAKVDIATFRSACRTYANSQIAIQKEEFKRLGVFGDWAHPYATMDFSYEAEVVRVLGKLIEAGLVYQGLKPVHWCIDCGSALAEAEVEYETKQSSAIDVAFQAIDKLAFSKVFGVTALQDKPLYVPIWTTTPWTLPANEAICLHPEMHYGLYETTTAYFVLAEALSEAAFNRYGLSDVVCLGESKGVGLADLLCQHPFLDKQVPLVLGQHVTTEAGTGCVHTAPAHGVEDYEVGLAYRLPCVNPVLSNGCYAADVPYFAGVHVFKANELVIEKLKTTSTLLALESLEHSYPHCWRHKSPMIFLTTPQWFVSMEKTKLREHILSAMEQIGFIPDWGKVRMAGMVSTRPDWCISRQRNWGTPIPVFIHAQTRKLHPRTADLIKQVAEIIEEKGIEAWFELDPVSLLGEEAQDYEKVVDTLDVWFDAGSSHAAVLRKNPAMSFPADLYLEGSDQYRGWFNSSLTTSIALSGEAPYKRVLTHGYTVDAYGKKLSKSQGNYVALDQLIEKFGADIIRLWVGSTDYRHEVSISDEILNRLSDAYRRIRNTARFLLSNLFDFDPTLHLLPPGELLELDRYILDQTQQLQNYIVKEYEHFQFHTIYQKVLHFCTIDLGGFYLDIIKDRQYTTGKDSVARRSCQTAMYHILHALTRWIAPILSYTAEEIWQHLPGHEEESVFLSSWYTKLPKVSNVNVVDWKTLQAVREEVNKALERAREAKIIGSGLAASVVVYAQPPLLDLLMRLGNELRFFFITSSAHVNDLASAPSSAVAVPGLGMALIVTANEDAKCVRCWHRCGDIGEVSAHPELCHRCADTVMGVEEVREFV